MSTIETSPVISTGSRARRKWQGDYIFLVRNLILKDFKIRYRNMSLGVFWSLLNPLVMMALLWFVFTKIFPNKSIPHFEVFLLCGLVPYNFFTVGWICGTTSLIDNAALIKRALIPRELIPISTVLGNVVNMSAQIGLLLLLVELSGLGFNRYWVWMPFIWACEILFVCGLSLITAALNVYIRDVRYVVESASVVLFWLVPIVYPFQFIAPQYAEFYRFNPLAAVVLASRNVLLEGIAPPASLLLKLVFSSTLALALGLLLFRKLQAKFYNYL